MKDSLGRTVCRRCGSTNRQPNGFSPKGGVRTRCRDCHYGDKRDFLKKHPGRYSANSTRNKKRRKREAELAGTVYRSWRPLRVLYKNAQNRARKYNVPFTITEQDIVIPEFCPILGVRLEHGRGVTTNNSPTLDRIVPALGYVPGNVAVICHKANRVKGNNDGATIMKIALWMQGRGV